MAAHAGTAGTAAKGGSDDGLDGGRYPGGSSDEDGAMDVKPTVSDHGGDGGGGGGHGKGQGGPAADPTTGKKTKGRVKIKMEFIDNKLRRYTTFSKRKTGIMKKVSKFYNQSPCRASAIHADIQGLII